MSDALEKIVFSSFQGLPPAKELPLQFPTRTIQFLVHKKENRPWWFDRYEPIGDEE